MRFLHSLVEGRIQAAMAAGQFDNLSGAGKPLPEDDLAGLPDEQRLAARVLRMSGYVPEEVYLLRQLEEMRGRVGEMDDGPERRRARAELLAREMKLAILLETAGRNRSAAR